ncbi:MAG TPA: hypothetical protein DIC53_04145 [Synergistaceae bacterium]|nr:hypothetical protein [Synergistaceae bacterium]
MKGTEKVMALVEALMSSERDVGIRDLAAQTDIPKSTVQRILSSLQGGGWVVQDPSTQSYRISLHLLTLANTWRLRLELNRQSREILEELSITTRHTVLLLVPSGSCGICLNKVEPERTLKLVAEVGKTFPLHAAACGKILLAYSSPILQDEILSAPVHSFTPSTITDPDLLREEIQLIRARGYAVSYGEMTAGAAEIAVPLLDQGGNVLAALSIAGPCFEMEGHLEEYEELLRLAADRILGHSSGF